MARWRTATALLALAACFTFAAAHTTSTIPKRHAMYEGRINVTVVNRCSQPVSFKAGFNFFVAADKGHPCPNRLPGPSPDLWACSTNWQSIKPDTSIELSDLPELLWSYSALVEGTRPAVYLSRHTDEALLTAAVDFNKECSEEEEGKCVWWAVPELIASGTRLVLRCPEIDDAAPAPAPVELAIELVNNCSVPVQVKVAYSMADGDSATGCAIDTWLGKENHLCVTDWQTLEVGEQRYIAATQDTFWTYGARMADDITYELAESVPGAFQGINDTTACPEEDAYGSGYVCEWWAPSFVSGTEPTPGPISITCDEYELSD